MRPEGSLRAVAAARRAATHEIDTNRRDVALGVGIVGEAQQKAGLSDTGVTNQDQLEDIVVLLRQ